MQRRTNDPNIPACQASIMCFSITDPEGVVSNYYSGLVDLPADINGSWDSYSLSNSTPEFFQPIVYNPSSNMFSVTYNISVDLWNPNGQYKTFMLPFYVDQGALSANIEMNMNVIISFTPSASNPNPNPPNVIKSGTVSTIKVLQNDEGAGVQYLDLYNFNLVQSPTYPDVGNFVIRSCTQRDQYFIILWMSIPASAGAIYPLMYAPNASMNNIGNSVPGTVTCNWWYWSDSPAINLGIPEPNPLPAHTVIIGSIGASLNEYTLANLDGNPPGPPFGNYYDHAEEL